MEKSETDGLRIEQGSGEGIGDKISALQLDSAITAIIVSLLSM